MLDTKAIASALAPIVKEHVAQATAPLLRRIEELESRQPENGKDGAPGEPGRDGADGKDAAPVTDEQIASAVERYLTANPPADGRDGADGKDGAPGKDGAQGEKGADGIGLAGALIDREGGLILTLTNGETKSLGIVVGRDGKDGRDGERGERGFSLDDFDTEMDGDGRTLRLKFIRGDAAEIHEIGFATMIYRGVFREGQSYERGDTVTWAGSLWHCDATTADKPGEHSASWTLAAKRGRDGKDFAGPQTKTLDKVRV